jgi:N-methylhydantoinase B
VVYTCKNDPMTAAYTFEGHVNPARGVRGGLAGQASDGWKLSETGEKIDLPMAATLVINPGECLVSKTGGGGGYGDPLTRDAALVANDVAEGWVSLQRAHDVYGVVLTESVSDPGMFIPDGAATAKLRAELSQARGIS